MIQAITTCVGYDDFLAETIVTNRNHFDHWVVVTTPDDERTQRLCEYHHVRCVQTTEFRNGNGEFHKGRGINVGLAQLSLDDWVLHLDADIALPPTFRSLIDSIPLDPAVLYGVDRYDVIGYRKWRRHLRHPRLQQEDNTYVHMDAFDVATRFMWQRMGGWMPIGYFQLWHPSHTGISRYPENHTDAGRTDMLHAQRWDRAHRQLIPEIVGYHLESERVKQGANWNGRRTRRFGSAWPIPSWWGQFWNWWMWNQPGPYGWGAW